MPTEPFVVKFPLLVVVALPPTQKLLETERLVVEALPATVRRLVALFQRKLPESVRVPPVEMKGMRPEVRLVMAREVVVALVEVLFTIVRLVMVEEAALARRPPLRKERPETV